MYMYSIVSIMTGICETLVECMYSVKISPNEQLRNKYIKGFKNLHSSTVLKFIFFHMTDFCIFCCDCFFPHWVGMGVAPLGKG